MPYLATKYDAYGKILPKDIEKAALVYQQLYFDGLMLSQSQVAYMMPVLYQSLQPNLEAYKRDVDALQSFDNMLGKFQAGDIMTNADLSFINTISAVENFGNEEVDVQTYENIKAGGMKNVKVY